LARCSAPALTQARPVNPSLLVYQEVRKARAEHVVASASQTRLSLHLHDGPEQARRDEMIARASLGESVNPDLWCARAAPATISAAKLTGDLQGRQELPAVRLGCRHPAADHRQIRRPADRSAREEGDVSDYPFVAVLLIF
jgi:hypothetical protein